jgi:hypothetical protein
MNIAADQEEALCLLGGGLDVRDSIFGQRITVPSKGIAEFVANKWARLVNVGIMGETFQTLFLNKVEKNVGKTILSIQPLESECTDSCILAELGNKAEIHLAHLFGLVSKQSKGGSGPLCNQGYANIAYIKDKKAVMWVVRIHWYKSHGSWIINAHQPGTGIMPAGCRVISDARTL